MEICVTNLLESIVHLNPNFSNYFSLLDSTQVPCDGEMPNFEELKTLEAAKQEKVQKLKILLEESNDAILEKKQTYPEVNYSTITTEEGKLLYVSKEHKIRNWMDFER